MATREEKSTARVASSVQKFVKEHEETLYTFCFYLVQDANEIDDIMVDTFRDFGHRYARAMDAHSALEPMEWKIRLFQSAWSRMRSILASQSYLNPSQGRDLRQLKGVDEDILKNWGAREKDVKKYDSALLERLARLDPDYRVVVVLHDILKMEDEEVMRIVGMRWGVYRHRLHRGRLEYRDGLRGKILSFDSKGSSTSG